MTHHLQGYFREVEDRLALSFSGWERDLSHPGEKGGIRQRRVADFLSKTLPKRYGVGSGHILASKGDPRISPQIDIILFDAVDGIELRVDDYYSLFPAESVYAAIEVKSVLTASDGSNGPQGTISECIEGATQVHQLDRGERGLSPIQNIVFAYRTDWSNDQPGKVKGWFETFAAKYSKRAPELVYVLEPSFALSASGPTGYNDEGVFSNLNESEALLFFVSDLFGRISRMETAQPHLWHEYVTWNPGDTIAKIFHRPGSGDPDDR